jgi:hypothetical protein
MRAQQCALDMRGVNRDRVVNACSEMDPLEK